MWYREGLHYCVHQIPDLLGMPMMFTLFEWVKDNLDTLLEGQPDAPPPQVGHSALLSDRPLPQVVPFRLTDLYLR